MTEKFIEIQICHTLDVEKDATKEDLKSCDEKTIIMIQDELGYFIAHDDLFSSWVDKGVNLGTSDVSEALIRFNTKIKPEYKKVYLNIFSTLRMAIR